MMVELGSKSSPPPLEVTESMEKILASSRDALPRQRQFVSRLTHSKQLNVFAVQDSTGVKHEGSHPDN